MTKSIPEATKQLPTRVKCRHAWNCITNCHKNNKTKQKKGMRTNHLEATAFPRHWLTLWDLLLSLTLKDICRPCLSMGRRWGELMRLRSLWTLSTSPWWRVPLTESNPDWKPPWRREIRHINTGRWQRRASENQTLCLNCASTEVCVSILLSNRPFYQTVFKQAPIIFKNRAPDWHYRCKGAFKYIFLGGGLVMKHTTCAVRGRVLSSL